MIRKLWKDSASVIIVSKAGFLNNVKSEVKPKEYDVKVQNTSNCKILMLRRSGKDSFMPGSFVFPGGNVDMSDSDDEWLNLYKQLGFATDDFEHIYALNGKCNAPIFQNNMNSMIPKTLSLRITAIRETFEECGILLCKHKPTTLSTHTPSERASYLMGDHIQEWQKDVKQDPFKFIKLCEALECFPDIWALRLWSNWLSPTTNHARFDTVFFVATFDQLPPVFIDDKEMDAKKWSTAENLIEQCEKGEIILPPPQFYELSRLKHFKAVEQLNNSAAQRQSFVCERWMPVQMKTSDGVLTVLPGDDLYPLEADIFRTGPMETLSESMAELRKSSTTFNRMEIQGKYITVVSNNDPSCGNTVFPVK